MPAILNMKRSGHGPTIVLVHGVAGSLSVWDPIIKDLEKNFDVVRMDLLGYGYSPKPRIEYTVDEHIESINLTLKKANVNGPFNMVGLSLGSLLVLNYTIKYPEKVNKIVGIGSLFYKDKEQAKQLISDNFWAKQAVGNKITSSIIVKTSWFIGLHSRSIRKLFMSELYTDEMARESLMNPFSVFRSTVHHCILDNLMPDLIQKVSSKEILLIHGSKDMWSPISNVINGIRNYKNIKLSALEGVSHNTVIVGPKETYAEVHKYFS